MAGTLFNDNPTTLDHSGVPTAIFSQPPVAAVGLTEARARERYAQVDVYRSTDRPLKHTLSGRDERTMPKLIVAPATDPRQECEHEDDARRTTGVVVRAYGRYPALVEMRWT